MAVETIMSGEIAVVIVNYRSADDTAACIETLEQTAGQLLAEIVVVDNASRDGSVERLRAAHPEVSLHELPENRGFAAGVNFGVTHSTAPILFVLNPDTIVRPGALEELHARLLSEPRLGVVGPLLLDGAGEPSHCTYKALPSLRSVFVGSFFPLDRVLTGSRWHPELASRSAARRDGPVARVSGAAMLFRRETWDDAGPMDETYFLYFEEVEWQTRVVGRGWRIEQVAAAEVEHAIRGGEVTETWPPVSVRSAFRFLSDRGHSPRTISAVMRLGFFGSRVVLFFAGHLPSLRGKARRMSAGYRALSRLAAELGDTSVKVRSA